MRSGTSVRGGEEWNKCKGEVRSGTSVRGEVRVGTSVRGR